MRLKETCGIIESIICLTHIENFRHRKVHILADSGLNFFLLFCFGFASITTSGVDCVEQDLTDAEIKGLKIYFVPACCFLSLLNMSRFEPSVLHISLVGRPEI